jgi:hypothetical protein
MAVNVSNIVVGEATLKLGDSANATSITAMDAFADLGATQNGVEISWEPDMVDIEIDQYGDAARIVQSKVKVMVKTTMAEATLNNLAVAWNYDQNTGGSSIAEDNAQDKAAFNVPGTAYTGDITTFKFGSQSVFPYEKGLVIEGTAPGSAAGAVKKRKFYTKRAISMEASNVTMKRAEASVFAVGFRILPSTNDTGYEYGKIIDNVHTS